MLCLCNYTFALTSYKSSEISKNLFLFRINKKNDMTHFSLKLNNSPFEIFNV